MCFACWPGNRPPCQATPVSRAGCTGPPINAARSQRRARVHHEQKLARFASESRESGQEEAPPAGDGEIDSAIDRLPSEERAAVVLRFYQDQDYAQISSPARGF